MIIQEDYFRNIFNTVRGAILILDQDMRVLSANRSFLTIFKVDAESTVGSLLYSLGNRQWDIPNLRILLDEILPHNDTVDDYEIEHDFESIGHKTMLLNACKIVEKEGALPIILLSIEDITERKRLEDLLSESEKRYRRIFDTANDGILLLEKHEGSIVQANPAAENMLGYSADEYQGKMLEDIGVPIDMSDFPKIMDSLNKNGILNFVDVAVTTKSGSSIDADIYLVDRASSAQCNIRDVTERKQSEDALRQSEKRFRILFEQAGDSILLLEIPSEGTPVIRDVNNATCKYLGFERDELIGQPVSIIDAVPDGFKAVKNRRHDITAGTGNVFELGHRCKDGTIRDFECSVSELQIGSQAFAISVEREITERKQSEIFKARLATAVEQAAEAIVITDVEANIVYVNPAFENITGYSRAEVYGQNARILKGGKHDAEFYRKLWTILSAGGTWRGHLVNKRKDDTLYEEEATISSVRDAAGKIINYVAVKYDVTREIHLEAQLRHSQKMEAVGTLAGGIAHDFNNILNVIIGYGTMVQETLPVDSSASEQMAEVLIAADRAATLTKRLLIFSRKQVVDVKPVNINELILGLQKMIARVFRENIDVVLTLADESLLVLADAGQIEQVLMNLAVNARDAMPDGGRLTIASAFESVDEEYVAAYGYGKPGAYALITVTDSGQGIDAATQEKIFEPFFTTKGIGEGTGLGLAISYGIIKQHGGFIKVYSESGQGAVFKILLPLSEDPAAAEKPAEETETLKWGTETVLLAEDDVAMRNLTRIVLESFGYTVIAATDGEEAIQKFMENREAISLVILDMIMPKKNGGEVREAINNVSPEMKILFTSGYTMDILKSSDLSDAGVNFISKPFQPQALLKKVREVLDR